MAVEFSELEQTIRVVINDINPDRYLYSRDVINSHLTLVSMMKGDGYELEGSIAFKSLTQKQKGLVVLECCLSILSPIPDRFSYKTPIHSVTRSNGVSKQIAWIHQKISEVESEDRIAYSDIFSDLIYSYERGVNAIDEALDQSSLG